MNRRRGCLWGIFQVSFVLCFTGGVILMALSQAVLRERITPGQAWQRLVDEPKTIRVASESSEIQPTVIVQVHSMDTPTPTVTPLPTMTVVPIQPDKPDHFEAIPLAIPTQTPVPTDTALATPSPTSTALTLRILPAPAETPTPFVEAALKPADSRIRIPKIGVDAPIVLAPLVDGQWQVRHLAQTVGHLERTANPGDQGNVVLTAAGSNRNGDGPAPFSHLATLTPGDLVLVYYHGQAFHYQIDYLATISAVDVAVTYPSSEPKITLLTHSDDERLMAVGILATEVD